MNDIVCISPVDGSEVARRRPACIEEISAALAASTRAAIDAASAEGDADTADLFTGVSRGLDKALWFLEAHLA